MYVTAIFKAFHEFSEFCTLATAISICFNQVLYELAVNNHDTCHDEINVKMKLKVSVKKYYFQTGSATSQANIKNKISNIYFFLSYLCDQKHKNIMGRKTRMETEGMYG